MMSKKMSVEAIADLYLYELSAREVKPVEGEVINDVYLDSILSSRGVYYDQNIIEDVLRLLTGKSLIKLQNGVGASTGFYKGSDKLFDYDFDPENIKSHVQLYVLTPKGRDFVEHKQHLDVEGERRKVENRKKIKERLIGAMISVLVAVTVFIIGNVIKEGNVTGKPSVIRDTVYIQHVPPNTQQKSAAHQ
ncbi:hypothetical protein HRG84_17740 [Flavisolibacter sp. BT320]|nr:hypothetical protein [Flavisolibacter longurius]